MQPDTKARLNMREKPVDQTSMMQQKWRDLLFLHWEYDPAEIQKTLPAGLKVDTFNGKAYIGLVPFFMQDVRLSFMPFLPGVSDFMELNVRTYVYDENGVPGVWFYSLEANSRLGVQGARSFFHLPYFYAEMRSKKTAKNEIDYECRRESLSHFPFARYVYKEQGERSFAQPDTLEFFLIERYALFSYDGTDLFTGRIHHLPYPICKAEVSVWDDSPIGWDGFQKPNQAPHHICFSPGVDVDIFNLVKN